MATNITCRDYTPQDGQRCAQICFAAFNDINRRHGFPPDFPNMDLAIGLFQLLESIPAVRGFVAESDGKIIGSNFIWSGAIGGVGPLTVDPTIQDKGAGRRLMQCVIDDADRQKLAGVRLVQAAFNGRSMSLYTRLGFVVREPLACLQGAPIRQRFAGCEVRPMTEADVDACCALCHDVHGHDRRGELPMGIAQGTAMVVQRDGMIAGYCTDIGFFAHAVAMDDVALMALIGAAPRISGPGFLLPSRNARVFRWCLENGLRYIQPMTLMSRGFYNDPRGSFIPSICF
jgi:GNAT superfamily N-acetyltransferase